MSATVIKVENLSKRYKLGYVGAGTFMEDIRGLLNSAVGRDDVSALEGETNDRTTKGNSNYIWAIKDINFDVQHGEVIGIIGKNGAGKSTLLKILSKITSPTTGTVKYKGRIGSLLEVGTGFHGELTGRENIFLNGAVLGMSKTEIKSKFDEIVDFAGVERYVDTPVKRYSSGMTVRLGFAVAAHLEPEILIIDEVLAVGDAEFQRKAIGKMQSISKNDGRTVLFVSHNMPTVKALCSKAIFLKNGQVNKVGNTNEVVEYYLTGEDYQREEEGDTSQLPRTAGNQNAIKKVWIEDEHGKPVSKILMGRPCKLFFRFDCKDEIITPGFGFGIENPEAERIFSMNNYTLNSGKITKAKSGVAVCEIPEMILMPGTYYLSLALVQSQTEWIDFVERAYSFTVVENDVFKTGKVWDKSQGIIYQHGSVDLLQ